MLAEEIFLAAIEKKTPGVRAAFLDGACQGDADLRAQVEGLLKSHDAAGSFLNQPLFEPAPTTGAPAQTEGPGTMIGPYKLLEPIGEGGMGTVWMAQQGEPIKRLVAIKLIKPGMDSKQVLARFDAERQALALMDHPNIAKVFDAGATPEQRPYFVMELVKGMSITKYCDKHHLTPRQRLELFVPICQAIQHAHQKGIIHRDIKPSNVLVALYDDRPVPKVIDFGVAKATGQQLTEATLHTNFGAVVGTIEYMSPEQASFNQLDVDTRSDIYSLGVLLYELLAGSPPFTKKELEKAGMMEMLRIIREQEPSKPSNKLSSSVALPSLSASRGTEPARLTRMVRGELDWIVMKALEKDRNRRYETANGFVMDVQRYLADEPVAAGPPSAGYRMRKFARRHRRGLFAAGAFVLLLMAAIVALTVALVEVNRERQQKETALEAEGKRRKQARTALDAMSSLIIDDWLAQQPVLLPEHKRFLEQMLRDYEQFAAETGQDEESRAGVAHAYGRVGNMRRRLGQVKDAEAAYETSREFFARLVADFPKVPDHREGLAKSHASLSAISGVKGKENEAATLLEQSGNIYRDLVTDFPEVPDYRQGLSGTLNRRGIILKNLGRTPEAEASYNQALVVQEQLVADFPAKALYRYELAQTYLNLGLLLDIAGRLPEAEQAGSQAVAHNAKLVADHPGDPRYLEWLAASRNNLGDTIRVAGRLPKAEEVFRESLKVRRQLVTEFPGVPEYWRGLAMTLNNLGIVLKDTNRVPEAEELYRQALAIHRRLAADYPTVMNHRNEAAGAMSNLARLLLARNEPIAARDLLEEALPHHHAVLKANETNPRYRRFYRLNRWRMAEVLLALKDHAAAAVAIEEFLEIAFEPPRDAYTAAGLLASCVRLAEQDKDLNENKRKMLATTYGDQALTALRQAIKKKAKEANQMAKDPSLDPLRQRMDFQKLLAEFESKANQEK